MNSRPYKIIFILLSCCIAFILVLQGFWIRNFYLQKKAEFDRTVYATLDQLAVKLQERENLHAIKMTYFIQNGDTIVRTPSRRMSITTRSGVGIINHSTKNVSTRKIISLNENGTQKVFKDSTVVSGKGQNIHIVLNGSKAKVNAGMRGKSIDEIIKESNNVIEKGRDVIEESKEITKLFDKMMTEIKVLDTEDNNPDTLGALIKKTLENKGLFMPFEFSIQKLGKGKKLVAQSPGFAKDKPAYKSDLSANKVFNTNRFLFLQFPDISSAIIRSMKSSLILSALFSLILIGVFYYTIRLILNQKKLSDIKNDFVNNMTHELKTPIATNALAIDAITNPLIKNDDEKFKDYIRILKEENQKLNTHVERVLQMALLDKGELRLDKTQVDPVALMTAVLESYKLQIAEQKAQVVFDPPAEKMAVYADAQHLQTVFSNLLDNALKYACDNCIIHIDITKSADKISIIFKDNGIGIGSEHREKVFDKFYRVQGGNLHDVKGFGLGLSYVRSIVEAHGGTIALKSEKGKGSEFIISLTVQADA